MKCLVSAALYVLLIASTYAVPVFTAKGDFDGDVITLYSDANVCVGDARYVEYVYADQRKIPGCWKLIHGGVTLVYFDADKGLLRSDELFPVNQI